MEKAMNIPEFTTIQEMATFWDTHEITDFEAELSEVTEPIFSLLEQKEFAVRLDEAHYTMLQKIAGQEHLNPMMLVQEWITEMIEAKYDAGQQRLKAHSA